MIVKDFEIILLSAAALLAVWLGVRLRRPDRRPLDERHMTETGFDASAVRPQIQRLRENHFIGGRCHPRDQHLRQELLASARRAVGCLPYFCGVRVEGAGASPHETKTAPAG